MALGSCYTCIKYLMFAFNFLFWLLGCAILGVGIWLRVDQNVAKFVHQSANIHIFYTLAYVMMAIGVLIMVIGFLGCCGAIRESQCMLLTFFIFLFVIFAALLGFGIWAVVAKDSMEEVSYNLLKDATEGYYEDEGDRKFMDAIQTSFHCCGYKDGAEDYKKLGIASSGEKGVPSTCSEDNYETPCNDAFYDFIANNLVIVAGVAIAIAIIMILGMIFSIVLCCAIRETVA